MRYGSLSIWRTKIVDWMTYSVLLSYQEQYHFAVCLSVCLSVLACQNTWLCKHYFIRGMGCAEVWQTADCDKMNVGIANASMTKPLLEPGMKEKKETR
jgi:hypothetical protein